MSGVTTMPRDFFSGSADGSSSAALLVTFGVTGAVGASASSAASSIVPSESGFVAAMVLPLSAAPSSNAQAGQLGAHGIVGRTVTRSSFTRSDSQTIPGA
ncbi:hypothetical protein GCM10009648_35620 [Tsukamurella spumae]